MGAQWLNIRVFDPRQIQAVASSSITGVTVLCPLARHINPCLGVQPRTTRPDITEKNVLLDIKNQINQIDVIYTSAQNHCSRNNVQLWKRNIVEINLVCIVY